MTDYRYTSDVLHCDRCSKPCGDDEPMRMLDGYLVCYSCRERRAIQQEEKMK